jgi:hypothetical protein
MQIRIQGKKVQLIRSAYDSAKKRCVQKMVHSFDDQLHGVWFPRLSAYLTPDQIADLSDAEKLQLHAWLERKRSEWEDKRDKRQLDSLESDFEQLSLYISPQTVNSDKATSIYRALALVSKALKKAGYSRQLSLSLDPTE